MADKRELAKRFGTIFLVLIFALSTIGLTALAFWQSNQDKDNQAELEQQLAAQQQTETFCDIRVPEAGPAETVPETFKPASDVSELVTTDVQAGNGKEAQAGDCLVMKYHGTLASSGEKFDGNFDTENALQFTLGAGNVIAGWDQGLVGMKEGGVRRVVIPSDLGYGETGAGSTIPPNADLVFVVKLVRIKEQ